jgi:hypothetical protein
MHEIASRSDCSPLSGANTISPAGTAAAALAPGSVRSPSLLRGGANRSSMASASSRACASSNARYRAAVCCSSDSSSCSALRRRSSYALNCATVCGARDKFQHARVGAPVLPRPQCTDLFLDRHILLHRLAPLCLLVSPVLCRGLLFQRHVLLSLLLERTLDTHPPSAALHGLGRWSRSGGRRGIWRRRASRPPRLLLRLRLCLLQFRGPGSHGDALPGMRRRL